MNFDDMRLRINFINKITINEVIHSDNSERIEIRIYFRNNNVFDINCSSDKLSDIEYQINSWSKTVDSMKPINLKEKKMEVLENEELAM